MFDFMYMAIVIVIVNVLESSIDCCVIRKGVVYDSPTIGKNYGEVYKFKCILIICIYVLIS